MFAIPDPKTLLMTRPAKKDANFHLIKGLDVS